MAALQLLLILFFTSASLHCDALPDEIALKHCVHPEENEEYKEGATCSAYGGLIILEHVNVIIPSYDFVDEFYVDLLGFVPHPSKSVGTTETGTIWYNAGMTQMHLTQGKTPQVISGQISLLYRDISRVKSRLLDEKYTKPFDGTMFSWSQFADGSLLVVEPYGNQFILQQYESGQERGRMIGSHQNGNNAEVLYINKVLFFCRMNTADKIGSFYERFFNATVKRRNDIDGNLLVSVEVGPYQKIEFKEAETRSRKYDGYHIAVYLKDKEAFEAAFKELEKNGLIFVNPRPRFGHADTIEKALEENQFRIKDIIDQETLEVLLELEHEVRIPSHKNSPFGK